MQFTLAFCSLYGCLAYGVNSRSFCVIYFCDSRRVTGASNCGCVFCELPQDPTVFRRPVRDVVVFYSVLCDVDFVSGFIVVVRKTSRTDNSLRMSK